VLNFQVVATGHQATSQLQAYEVGGQRLLQMSFGDLEGARRLPRGPGPARLIATIHREGDVDKVSGAT